MTPGHSVAAETALPEPAVSFGALLRAHRHAAKLTQAELAGRAGLGVRTVRDLEHGKAARPQRTTVELLARALGLRTESVAEFFAVARGQTTPRGAPHTDVIRLPAPPELFGRAAEVNSLVTHLVARAGVTTLVGLAGVGKSALALTVAHHAQGSFSGGVAGISIAVGDTAADVREVTCAVLSVARPEELPARLAEPVLLMVDAIDHSPQALGVVLGELTSISPQLRVLASSRAPLMLPGELVWPVGPLALPPADVSTVTEAEGHPASALFLARWRQVRGGPPADAEVAAVVSLVRRLGGLPLAIELAAARGRVLDPQEMLARYGDRLLELGSATDGAAVNSVTLRDVVTASYRLLEPAQRWALRRFAGFGYRWSIELAEELLGPQVDVVPALEHLVDLGLVQVRGVGAFRFVLLDVVKAFATEESAAAGELGEIRRQHAVVFARFAARTAPDLMGAKLPAAVARLDEVACDLWAALAYAATDDPHTALCLASKLTRWWRFRGRDQQGRQWLRQLVDDPRTADADPTVRAWAQLGVAQLAYEHNAGPQELPRADDALAAFVLSGDVTGELAARSLLLAIHQSIGSYDEARRHGEAALSLSTRAGRVRDMAVAQNNLIWHDLRIADLAAAQRRLAAVDRLSARAGEHKLRALARANLAEVLRLDGRYDESVQVGLRAVEMLAEVGDPGHRRRLLGVVGLSYALGGRLEEGEKVLAEIRAQLPDEVFADRRPDGMPAAAGAGAAGAGEGTPAEDWDCSMIEATLAGQRGQRMLAASWYAAAAGHGGSDARDRAEALVGVIVTADDSDAARAQLAELCASAGIALTARERAQLEALA